VPSELWKDIPGYEGQYQVSDLGYVKSLSRRVKCRGGTRSVQEYILKIIQRPDGYCVVGVKKGMVRLHRLVLLAFVGPCPEGKECRHLDGNRQNNRLTNLCWGTRSENAQDRVRHGWRNQPNMKPVRCSNGRVFESASAAARAIGTSQGNVSKVCRRGRGTLKGLTFEYIK
jgi:hypothetical protein